MEPFQSEEHDEPKLNGSGNRDCAVAITQIRVSGMQTRIAIVGTGNIARVHVRALASLSRGKARNAGGPAATIVAAMDTDDSQLGPFCAQFGIPGAYGELDGMLSRAWPDLVHICTPPAAHYPVALDCLRAGVSVLAEKPPAISLREFDELTAAGGGPPWFATVFQHRFGSGQRRLKALAASGVLGRPLLAVCHTTWFRDQAYFDVPWRGRWDTEGGGPTMGHGIHQMDMLLDVLGDWTEVSAIARTQARRMATEDLSLAHVTFGSGAVASVVNSVLSPREESYLRFDFERATVEVTHLYGYGDDDWRVTPAPGCEDQVLAAWRHGEHGARSGHAGQFAAVIGALRGGGTGPPVAAAEARRTMALVAGIYASAFTRRPVTPGDLTPGTPFYGRMNGGNPAW
jgi:predicted dehydrogenase